MLKQRLIEHLRRLGNGAMPSQKSEGICLEVHEFLHENIHVNQIQIIVSYKKQVAVAMQTWPKRSSSTTYPVPHPSKAAYAAYMQDNIWGNDEYGNNRRELCLWIADQLEQSKC